MTKVLIFLISLSYPAEKAGGCSLAEFVLLLPARSGMEEIMPNIHVDKVGEMAVVECEGRFVRSDEAFKMRDAVTSQRDARIIVLDLTEVLAIGGGGIGVLVFLQRWCRDHDIRFKLFNPSRSVRERLENTNAMSEFDIASLDEMMALLGKADRRYALAS
jgi:anti-anti-sigma factor